MFHTFIINMVTINNITKTQQDFITFTSVQQSKTTFYLAYGCNHNPFQEKRMNSQSLTLIVDFGFGVPFNHLDKFCLLSSRFASLLRG